jgi:sugar fermentation stimulation protein A|tara:strand:- start:7473 stop:7916 length:444 start_codon:yes stop_codon:yes gene_type:complete
VDEIGAYMVLFQKVSNDFQTYCLIINKKKRSRLEIGKLGIFDFPSGFYIYTGSAKKNRMSSRIKRHLSRDKTLHWHIDYLLEESVIKDVFLSREKECDINRDILLLPNATIISNNFGSSDCSCESHLTYFKDQKSIPNNLEKMEVLL